MKITHMPNSRGKHALLWDTFFDIYSIMHVCCVFHLILNIGQTSLPILLWPPKLVRQEKLVFLSVWLSPRSLQALS